MTLLRSGIFENNKRRYACMGVIAVIVNNTRDNKKQTIGNGNMCIYIFTQQNG